MLILLNFLAVIGSGLWLWFVLLSKAINTVRERAAHMFAIRQLINGDSHTALLCGNALQPVTRHSAEGNAWSQDGRPAGSLKSVRPKR